MTIFRLDKLKTLKGIGALPEGHTYDASSDTVWSQNPDGARVGMSSEEYAKRKLRGHSNPFGPDAPAPASAPSRVALAVGEPEILARKPAIPDMGGPSSPQAAMVAAALGQSGAPAASRDADAEEMEAADEEERRSRFAAGMGKAGQMFAQAFGAKNADPASFDRMAQDAGKRRQLVTEHYRAKAQRDADWKRNRTTQLEDLESTRVFQGQEKEKDRTLREEENRQRAADRLLQRQFMMATLGQRHEDKREKDTDKQIEVLSKRMEGAPALRSDIATLEKLAGEDDVPGIGATGRLPDFFVSDEGVQLRQATRGIVGNLIKERSGTAASEKEIDRILGELGMGDGATDDQFRMGLKRLKQQSIEAMRAKEAGARPEAVEEARRRGLTTSQDLAGPAAGGLSPTDKARLEELRRKRDAGLLR